MWLLCFQYPLADRVPCHPQKMLLKKTDLYSLSVSSSGSSPLPPVTVISYARFSLVLSVSSSGSSPLPPNGRAVFISTPKLSVSSSGSSPLPPQPAEEHRGYFSLILERSRPHFWHLNASFFPFPSYQHLSYHDLSRTSLFASRKGRVSRKHQYMFGYKNSKRCEIPAKSGRNLTGLGGTRGSVSNRPLKWAIFWPGSLSSLSSLLPKNKKLADQPPARAANRRSSMQITPDEPALFAPHQRRRHEKASGADACVPSDASASHCPAPVKPLPESA